MEKIAIGCLASALLPLTLGSQAALAAEDALKSGQFSFYCSIPGHREAGMEGIVKIVD